MLWCGLFELQVCLEHVFHLLCNGLIDEAYQTLSLAESWRHGEQTSVQDKEMKLIEAYRGLLDYYSWAKQKHILLEHGKSLWCFVLSRQLQFAHTDTVVCNDTFSMHVAPLPLCAYGGIRGKH